MKQIILERLTLRNFKGIREFTLDAGGDDVNVYGDNATGKTTLFDAFTWLLFGKDSENKTDFEIKTLRPDGSHIHNLEHEVEATLMIDGQRTTLRRVFKEKWTKKRGSARAEFTGHTTDYFVDGVPMKESEYKAVVSGIVDEAVFKLLTSPTFFNEQLKKQERRKILLEVCGDFSDEDVIASNPALAELPAILQGKTIEAHKKVVSARRKAINEELETIPIRISEAQRSIPEMPAEDESYFADRIAELSEIIEQKQADIIRIQSGGEVTAKQNRIREIEGELIELKNRLQGDTFERIASKRQEESALRHNIEMIQFEIDSLKRSIERNRQQIESKEVERDRLRQQWHEVNGRTFAGHHHDEICAACGQPLPVEKIAEAHRKAEEAFNLAKSRELEQIGVRGKSLTAEIEELKQQNEAYDAKIELLQGKWQAYNDALTTVSTDLAELQASIVDVESHPEYQTKQTEIAAIRSEIAVLQDSTAQAVADVRNEIAALKEQIAVLERERAKFSLAESARRRIAELEKQEKELAEEFERLEHELFLLDEFMRSKVELLESRINSKFRLARFKLFNQQVNGGLEETCEVMYEGVPYNSLNNAMRHNIGLDIITTLSEHYGIAAPIFLDNAESITRPLDTPGQQVRLIVSASDKQLRVELQKETVKEAV